MILRADNIMKMYGNRKVVKSISLQVEQGEIIGLLGPNGAGKTTSFYMIVGMIKPNEGKIYLDDVEITNDSMFKRARKELVIWPRKRRYSENYPLKIISCRFYNSLN